MEIARFHKSAVVSLTGRIDHTIATQFEQKLMALVEESCELGAVVVIDMEGVEYMSSVGLRVLMVAAIYCNSEGGTVLISSLQATMQEIFEISRFDRIFSVYPDIHSALIDVDPEAAADYSDQVRDGSPV